MEKINKLLNYSTNYTENLKEIMYLIKMNMKVFVSFSIKVFMKKNESFFTNMNIKVKLKGFSKSKLKFQLRTLKKCLCFHI